MGARGPIARKTAAKGPPPGRPDRPKELSAEAAAEWDRIAEQLESAGLLSRIDRAALAAYCVCWQELMSATTTLEQEGRYIRVPIQTARGDTVGERVAPHPAVKVQADALSRLRGFLQELGLSPSARARIGTGAGEVEGKPNRLAAIADMMRGAK